MSHYKGLFDSDEAHEVPLAEPWHARLTSFQRLCILRCLRPDKVSVAVQAFVGEHLGGRFVEPPPFDLATCYRDAAPATPLIFVLSPGADPMADLLKLAEDMRFSKKFEKVSLGQGQGPKAEKLLEAGMERGLWVCLQVGRLPVCPSVCLSVCLSVCFLTVRLQAFHTSATYGLATHCIKACFVH